MGRRPIGRVAMTAAERQRKRRERLGIGGLYLPNFLPWDQSLLDGGVRDPDLIPDRAVSRFLDQLEHWMDYGETEQVGRWLWLRAGHRWDELDALVRAKLADRGDG